MSINKINAVANIVVIFYLLPSALLLLFEGLRKVRNERKGWRCRSGYHNLVFLVPVLNLYMLALLCMVLIDKALGHAMAWLDDITGHKQNKTDYERD